MKFTKLSQLLKNDYMKTIILVTILFAGIFAFWFGLRFAFQTEYPLLAVASGSMVPTLNVGDLILVQGGLNYSELKVGYMDDPVPGEIIVYRVPPEFRHMFKDPNELIVHRAVAKEFNDGSWYFYTKGDAGGGRGHDSWNPIKQDYIIGKVVRKVPWIGYIPLFLRTPSGILLIVFLFVFLIIVDFIFPRKEDEKTRGREEKLLSIYR